MIGSPLLEECMSSWRVTTAAAPCCSAHGGGARGRGTWFATLLHHHLRSASPSLFLYPSYQPIPRSTAGQGRSAGGGVWALGPIPHLCAWAVLTGLHQRCPQADCSHHASSTENGCGACRPATLPEPVGRASPLPSY